jgi:hypothetical protein
MGSDGRIRPTAWLVAGALAASLAANVAQFVWWRQEKQAATSAPQVASSAERRRLSATFGTRLIEDPSLDCDAQVRVLEERRATILERIEDERPVVDRYEEGTPDPTKTAEMRAIVERLFAAAAVSAPFDLACRGRACKLEFQSGVEPPPQWQATLFGSPEFVERVDDKVTMGAGRAIFPLRRDRAAGETKAALTRVLKAFKYGPAVRVCSSRHPDAGRLDVALWLATPAEEIPPAAEHLNNGLILWVGGELASTAVGDCIARSLREAALTAVLPGHRTPAKVATNFALPGT